MQRLRTGVWALSITVILTGISSGCLASRKFVRNEVKTSSDALSAQIDATNGQLKETQDSVNQVNQRVTTVDQRETTVDQKVTSNDQRINSRVDEVDGRTTQNTQGVATLRTDVSNVNTKTDTTNRNLTALDSKFQKRNNYQIASSKTVLFKFDSAKLDKDNMAPLDEIASAIMQNPDAILVLEGHTDSTGDKDYNIRLGERRVEAVKRYLAVDKGIPVYRIEEMSFGADKPLGPNDSKTAREQNRAVTLSILTPALDGNATAANR
jgi:outer membrane protein OmpA-like peptidoglycan-associated protein